MTFYLRSHTSLQSNTSHYPIETDAPVRLYLQGNSGYCKLNDIQNPQLKEVLAKVGKKFKDALQCTFFNVHHIFRPSNEEGSIEDKDKLAPVIFEFVKTEINKQAKDEFKLDLTDVKSIFVRNAEDHSFKIPHHAYELGIEISDEVLEAAQKSGLLVTKHVNNSTKNTLAKEAGVEEKKF